MDSKALLNRYSCWIFDMDGTLTIPQHDFAAIRQRLSIPPESDILGHIAQRSPEEQQQAKQILYEWEHELAHFAQPDPSAKALLSLLKSKGHRLGVLTRNLTALAHITLKAAGLAAYFEKEVILGRDIGIPKPDPDGIYRICNYFSHPPAQSIMVGDYIHDTQAGRQAGCFTILIDAQGELGHPPCTNIRVQSLSEILKQLT